ncbi:hypothetical protein [Bradyrhizobium sp. ORS 86]|uniref:hypothetical protein n=1 Tax=Bradyrhizobium sp. ORS 86 TaxID=1685970 RepID=UPI003890EAC8
MPPSEPFETSTNWPVRANAPALAARRKPAPPAAPVVRDKVRAPNDRRPLRDLPHIPFNGRCRPINEVRMTAYLISLALAGLVAIALCEVA